MEKRDELYKGKAKSVGGAKNIKKVGNSPAIADADAEIPEAVETGFSIGKLFSACLPGRRTSPSSALNN